MAKTPIPRNPRVTLATVAGRAGVSVTTVSVVLSGQPKMLQRYRSQTIAKVRCAAKKLGYRANLFATGLPTQRSLFFALVLPDFRKETMGTAHLLGYEGALLSGVISTGTEQGLYPVTVMVSRDPDEAAIQAAGRVIDGGVFGSIVRSPNAVFDRFLFSRLRAGHPVVGIFPRRLSHWATNGIDVDNRAIGRTAASLIAPRNRRRWVLVRYERWGESNRLRCEGFVQAAREIGREVTAIRLPMQINEYQAADFLANRFDKLRPDAVFGPESTSSIGGALACTRLGMKPGEDYDLVGCDSAAWQMPGMPAITCVDISWEAVGTRAVQELALMHQTGAREFPTVLLPPRIVARDTCPVPETLQPMVSA